MPRNIQFEEKRQSPRDIVSVSMATPAMFDWPLAERRRPRAVVLIA